MRLTIAVTLILLTAPAINSWAHAAVNSTRCSHPAMVSSLLGSFAINAHLQQGGQYDDAAKAVSVLKELGIKQIRDAFPGLGHAGLEYAAREGIKFDFVINAGWGLGVIRALEDWELRYPGSIIAIEGPNEVNNWPVTYESQTGIPAAQAFQRDLYAGVHSSPVLSHIPVVALTSWPVFENKSDIGNIHAYSRSGSFMSADIRKADGDEKTLNLPVKPIWMTEAGYHTHIGNDHDEGVSEPVQAKMVATLFLSAFEQGIQKTFLYQLADQYTDPNDEQSYFGLVDLKWREKPAFLVLKNMIDILSKDNNQATSQRGLDFELQGLPVTAHQRLLQNDRGNPILAVWDEPELWDRSVKREIRITPTILTLKLGQLASEIELFDPLDGTKAVRTVEKANAFTFALTDHPLFIRIHPAASSELCQGIDTQ